LKEERDLRYEEQIKFSKEFERFQSKLKNWEEECHDLEVIKRKNEDEVRCAKDEFREKEFHYEMLIENLKRADQS